MCKVLCALRHLFLLDRRKELRVVSVDRRRTPSNEADKKLLESIYRLEQTVNTCRRKINQ